MARVRDGYIYVHTRGALQVLDLVFTHLHLKLNRGVKRKKESVLFDQICSHQHLCVYVRESARACKFERERA